MSHARARSAMHIRPETRELADSLDHDRFEAWFVANADLTATPVGSPDFCRQWKAWQAAVQSEREACARVCDARADDARVRSYDPADTRAATAFYEAEECAYAIRMRAKSGIDGEG